MIYKLYCTVTMKSYVIEAECEYIAKMILASQLGVPISCISVRK